MFKNDIRNVSLEGITLKELWNNHIAKYPTPSNLSYLWGFGSLAGICLGIQLLSGIFLNMYYVSHPDYAFQSIEYIMREVNFGWFVRYCHSNGASFFFLITYLHIGRAVYFRSYKTKFFLWYSGLILFFAMMGTAFLGYVLPWGQMSFWGAMVITKILGSLPFVGENLELWIWGGSTVTGLTLHRFLALHYVLGFVLTGLVFMHLVLLHDVGSNRPLKTTFEVENVPFYPTYVVKDVFVLTIMLVVFFCVACFYSNVFGHPDNYIIANSMVTPLHIVPEWYFLPFYAALRAIDNKILGIVYMVSIILSLFLLPVIDTGKTRNPRNRPLFRLFFWIWVTAWIGLGFLGGQPLVYPFTVMHKPLLIIYFAFFLGIKLSSMIELSAYKNYTKSILFLIPNDFIYVQAESYFMLLIIAVILFKIFNNNNIPNFFYTAILLLMFKNLQTIDLLNCKLIFNGLMVYSAGTVILKNFLILLFILMTIGFLVFNERIIKKPDFLIIFLSIFLILCIGIQINDFFLVYLVIEALALLQISLILVYSPEIKTPEMVVKYFQINLIASVFLLMGIAWLYQGTGSTNFIDVYYTLHSAPDFYWALPIFFILGGFFIKMIAVPFHLWAIEIYSKLPLVSLLILLVPIKTGLFFIFFKILYLPFGCVYNLWSSYVYIIGICCILQSSISLLFCKKIKFFFIFSSINQTGISLIALSTGSLNGITACWSYLLGYMVFVLFAFLLLIKFEMKNINTTFIDYINKKISIDEGLSLSICFWSLSGFPISLGFLTKIVVANNLYETGYFICLIIFLVTSSLSLFAYFTLIKKILLNWVDKTKFSMKLSIISFLFFSISIALFPLLLMWVGKL